MSDCCCSIWHSLFDIDLFLIIFVNGSEVLICLFLIRQLNLERGPPFACISGEGKGGGAYLRGEVLILNFTFNREGAYSRKYGIYMHIYIYIYIYIFIFQLIFYFS